MKTGILDELSTYAKQAGLSSSTVCVRALGNSRFPERHLRRLRQIAEDEARLRDYMAANPPKKDAAA
jgi:hypothetical protein